MTGDGVLADLACVIADGVEEVSDFRVIGDEAGLFGPVASVPTAWRTLAEVAGGEPERPAALDAAIAALPEPAQRRLVVTATAQGSALP